MGRVSMMKREKLVDLQLAAAGWISLQIAQSAKHKHCF